MPGRLKPWKTSRHTFPRSRKPSGGLNEAADFVAAEQQTKTDEIGGSMQTMTVLEASEGRAPKITQATTSPFVGKVFSKDGTAIAFDRIGNGPPVILVDGALCYRGMGQSGQLAKLLAQHFTVFTYDRRGRGGSGDTAPYAVEREVEDIAVLLSEAGGAAFVWGMSSGAVLALEAANRLRGSRSWRCTKHRSSLTTAVPQQRAIGQGSLRRSRQISAARRSSSF